MNTNKTSPKLVYIIGTYPRLTTTFIDREIKILRDWGAEIKIISARRPDGNLSAKEKELQQGVTYLLPANWFIVLWAHLRFVLLMPLTYISTLFYLFTRPHPDLQSRFLTIMHFGMGVYAAHLLRHHSVNQVHAHFVDRATTLALIVGRLLKVPYSATAHANDIYVNPVLLPEKISNAKFIATCTGYNKKHLSTIETSFSDKIHLVYHGLDVDNYHPEHLASDTRPTLVAVGQLKEKKGFTYLIQACRQLKDQGYEFDCQIVGEGPLRETLEAQIRTLALEDTITLCGALPHREVINKYKNANLFVLPCVLSANGDRDGIPNVILEAMAMELPVVSTRHSGIPEVITDKQNGLLVPPEDVTALTKALATLLDDTGQRHQLGQQARQTILEDFAVEQNVRRLMTKFAR